MAKPPGARSSKQEREGGTAKAEAAAAAEAAAGPGPMMYALIGLSICLGLLALLYASADATEPTVVAAAPASAGDDPRKRREQWAPVSVGHRRVLHFADGRRVPMTTLAKRPALFHLEGFLSPAEVDAILAAAPEAHFRASSTTEHGGKVAADKERVSETQFVQSSQPGLEPLQRRVADLVALPLPWVEQTSMQVLRYAGQSFYATHYDSRQLATYTQCRDEWEAKGFATDEDNRCPRYVTILYYLSDVASGGETCFPLADEPLLAAMGDAELEAHQRKPHFMRNASVRCIHQASGAVLAAPRRGDAIMWYNYRLAEDGALREVDGLAAHMALIPAAGSVKLAANHWLTVPYWPDAAPGEDRAAGAEL